MLSCVQIQFSMCVCAMLSVCVCPQHHSLFLNWWRFLTSSNPTLQDHKPRPDSRLLSERTAMGRLKEYEAIILESPLVPCIGPSIFSQVIHTQWRSDFQSGASPELRDAVLKINMHSIVKKTCHQCNYISDVT